MTFFCSSFVKLERSLCGTDGGDPKQGPPRYSQYLGGPVRTCPCVKLLNVRFEKLTDGTLAAAATATITAVVAAVVAAATASTSAAAAATGACCWRRSRDDRSYCSQVFARTARRDDDRAMLSAAVDTCQCFAFGVPSCLIPYLCVY